MAHLLCEEMFTEESQHADILLKGIPFDNACSVGKGAALAPELMRSFWCALPAVTETGIKIKNLKIFDEGDFEPDLNWERYFKTVQVGARELFNTNKFCVFMGGDHSVSIPLINAFCDFNAGKKIGVIHFDAHLDITIEYEGHPWSHACTERRVLENKNMSPGGLTFVGIRSYLEEELDFLAGNPGIRVIGAHEVYKKGIEYTLNILRERYKDFDAVYVTIDIDVLDPAYAPGTGTPEGGGLTTREMMELIRDIIAELPVKAMDIVEVSPPLDTRNNVTTWAALKILWEAFGVLDLKKLKKEYIDISSKCRFED